MLMKSARFQNEINRLKAQNAALWEALKAANEENERLTDSLQKLTVDLCVAEAENDRALRQVDILRGVESA